MIEEHCQRSHNTRREKITELANALFPLFLVIAVGIICYSSSFHASFHFDDYPAIVENERIKNLSDLNSIWKKHNTRFLPYVSFALNYHFHGLKPFGYHLINTIIHILGALMVYWLVRVIFLTPEVVDSPLADHSKNIALAVALVFVSHPIETQAVTYIVQRVASLASLFYLMSLFFYIKARLHYDRGNRRHIFLYGSAIAVAVFAMFSKEISVTLPLCVLAVEYFFFCPSPVKIWRRLSYLWPMFLTLPIIPLTWIATRKEMIDHLGLAAETDTISRLDYLLTQVNVINSYLGLLFLPIRQSVDYDFPIARHFFEPKILVSFTLILSLSLLALVLFKKHRVISFGIAFFFLTLAVESSLIPIRDVIFEHRVYLPSVGIFLSVTCLVFQLLGHRKKIIFCLFALIVSLESAATINRNIIWRRPILLWHDAAKTAPQKSRVYINRGVGYDDLGKMDQALRDFDLAITMNEKNPHGYLNRGILSMQKGEYDSAVTEFNKAIRVQPNMGRTYSNRGIALMALGRFDEAYKDFYNAVRLEPRNPYHLNALGTVCNKVKRYDLALLAFSKAISLNDKFSTPYLNRGKTYRSMRRYKEAIDNFNKAAELSPESFHIYHERGLAHEGLKDHKTAVKDFTRAILGNPEFVEAYADRGAVYERLGYYDRALVDLNKALELNPGSAKLYKSRGEVYGRLGLTKKAKEDSERARELSNKNG